VGWVEVRVGKEGEAGREETVRVGAGAMVRVA
jgi:hypothetical protein